MMPERIGNYSEAESDELWNSWSNQIAIDNPAFAEEFVQKMLEGDEDGTE